MSSDLRSLERKRFDHINLLSNEGRLRDSNRGFDAGNNLAEPIPSKIVNVDIERRYNSFLDQQRHRELLRKLEEISCQLIENVGHCSKRIDLLEKRLEQLIVECRRMSDMQRSFQDRFQDRFQSDVSNKDCCRSSLFLSFDEERLTLNERSMKQTEDKLATSNEVSSDIIDILNEDMIFSQNC